MRSCAVDPGNERDVLAAGQRTVKRAAKAKWKRHPGIPPDNSAIGYLGPGNQSNQGRLAGAVDPENAKIITRFKGGADIVKHSPSPASRAIDFGDPFEGDPSGS